MFTDGPFALFISWTCFGNWLPGDERGYVSNTLLPGGMWLPKENVPGTPYTKDDPLTQHQARILMNQPPTRLTSSQALAVAESLVGAAQKRGWRIPRASIMANHVHVVITECPDDGRAVRRILKGVSQAALSDEFGENRRWWTRGGSDHYLHTEEAIMAAIRYVAEQQFKLAEIIDMKAIAVT
jgi:REP element-mobilizing transposase RayT